MATWQHTAVVDRQCHHVSPLHSWGRKLPGSSMLPARFTRGMCPTLGVRRRPCRLSVSARAHDPHEPVLAGVDELPDGTVVLHFGEDGDEAPVEAEKQLVGFLTKQVTGQKKRDVSDEVLEEVLGSHYHPHENPISSFVKGVLNPNGAPVTHTTPAPQPVPTAAPSQKVLDPKAAEGRASAPAGAVLLKPEAPKSTPTQSPRSQGLDQVRAVSVLIAATITTTILRVLGLTFRVGGSGPLTSPMSILGTGVLFGVVYAALWVTGFAKLPETKEVAA